MFFIIYSTIAGEPENYSVMENILKFVVHGRKEGDKFILEGITNFIMKSLESYDGKLIIVTFELPVTTNEIQMDNCILIN